MIQNLKQHSAVQDFMVMFTEGSWYNLHVALWIVPLLIKGSRKIYVLCTAHAIWKLKSQKVSTQCIIAEKKVLALYRWLMKKYWPRTKFLCWRHKQHWPQVIYLIRWGSGVLYSPPLPRTSIRMCCTNQTHRYSLQIRIWSMRKTSSVQMRMCSTSKVFHQ